MSLYDKSPSAKESQSGTEYSAEPLASIAPSTAPPAPITNTPLPQDATRRYPQYQSHLQNTGMTVGAMAGVLSGDNAGSTAGDMLVGGVVGGAVGQRLAQAENHAFWREQAMQYREGRAAGVILPPSDEGIGHKASWWSKEGRAQRRAERWERRAKRRDGTDAKD